MINQAIGHEQFGSQPLSQICSDKDPQNQMIDLIDHATIKFIAIRDSNALWVSGASRE